MRKVGYVRVSSKEQNEGRQITSMENEKVDKIYIDKQSGKDFDRAAYQQMLSELKEGDVVILHSLDRLGRNYDAIIEEWRKITKEIKADIKVLDMPLLDTTASTNDLTGKFLADLVLQVLSFVAQNELDYIKQRQKEGIEAAKLKGKHLGRPFCEIPDNFENIVLKYATKEITLIDALDESRLSRSSFYKYSKELQKRKKL